MQFYGFQNHFRHGNYKKSPNYESNLSCPQHKQTQYQLNYQTMYVHSSYETSEVTMKKVENKIVYYKGTMQWQHLIFWPGNHRRVHCHTTKLEQNQSVLINRIPLVIHGNISCVRSSQITVNPLETFLNTKKDESV
jgi:hypothetical protein